jgi:hypothetical protein
MKDLILISNYSETYEKQEVLRNLVNQIHKQKSHFDLLIVSHTIVPQDISDKCDYVLYDKKNELIYDWDLRCKPWFNPGNERQILSIFTGFYNSHIAIWRMIILGNGLAKNLGYNKVHHIEYDASINNFSELYENSKLLDSNNSVYYVKSQSTVDDILFGSYQAYRLDTLNSELLNLNEEKLKEKIRKIEDKSPEMMLQKVLISSGKTIVKTKDKLDANGNNFGLTHSKLATGHTAWCLPYYDKLTNKLGFVIWNMEDQNGTINVKLIYNNDRLIDMGDILNKHWRLIDIDDYNNAKKLTVIVNDKIRNIFDFEKDGDMFKTVSFREEFNKK